MSVNYEARAVYGWEIPSNLVDTINELTDYKYEDMFHRCNAYSDYNDFVYFGEEVHNIPCGWASPLYEIFSGAIDRTIDEDAIRQELASDIECYNAVASYPNIYIMCCVL